MIIFRLALLYLVSGQWLQGYCAFEMLRHRALSRQGTSVDTGMVNHQDQYPSDVRRIPKPYEIFQKTMTGSWCLRSTMGGNFNVKDLLNQDQEVGIVNRANEEWILMEEMQDVLQMKSKQERDAAKKRVKKLLSRQGTSMSSGFGAGSGGGNKQKSKGMGDTTKVDKARQTIFNGGKIDEDGYGALIVEEGVVRINDVLKENTAEALREFINTTLIESEKDVSDGSVPQSERFANVLVKKGRWDLLLPLEESSGIVKKALYEILHPEGRVCSVLQSVLGKKAELYEWASLISDPGSDRQVIHPDIPYENRDVSLLTCFFALQDIEADMGATIYIPGTQSKEDHARNDNRQERDELLRTTPNYLALLNKGDCAIYDPRVLHAGGANRSQTGKRRVICYFTFRNPNLPDPRLPNNPGSIREDIKQRRLSLPELQRMVGYQ